MSNLPTSRQPPKRPPFVLLQAVLAGDFGPDVVDWLQQAFRQHERQRAALPLERYLRLPTFKAHRRQTRDFWIAEAARLIDAPTLTARSERLAAELSRFMVRGPWPAWQRAGAAPADATELQRCLFEIAKNHDRTSPPGAKTILRKLARTD